METYNDEEIRSQLQNPTTQRSAFELVVRKYSTPLYWQIRRLVISHEDANDLLQNTFIKAWSHVDYFRGEAKLSTWLYRVAFNECLNFLNQKKLRTNISIDEAESLTAHFESDPYFDGDKTQQRFLQAVASLPEKQRIIFNLKYFQEMKYEEISEIMGTSVGALKASYHHAVKKISSFLQQGD